MAAYRNGRGMLRAWYYLLAVLIGIVLGGLVAKLVEGSPYLWWLGWGLDFGFDMDQPLHIDLGVLRFTFALGIWIKINVATIVGIVLSILLFRKL